MADIKLLQFQENAIEELTNKFTELWKSKENWLPLLLKSPTGSGKTFMVSNFIRDLNRLPNWDQDKTFIWITFSDDIAMQSKDKFNIYFKNNIENTTLTVNDIDRGKLFKNDILFLNWQKIVSKSAKNRVLRRPEDELMQKESGKYFEDMIDNTHLDNRKIILIIDEAHKNTKTQLSQEIISYINPKIIFYVTATPDEKIELEARRLDGYVEVSREDVVKEGLIKEKVVVQTDEDLLKFKGKDLDEVLLMLSMKKREELLKEYIKLNKNINPLLLIQLPNDDKKLIDLGQKTKEQIVLDFLYSNGVREDEIAIWFETKQKNMEFITDNDSDVNYLLFKQAAGTGWDCPRAHVLLMYREINSATFYTQTVGRILRMIEPCKKEDYINNVNIRTGFLYTNYKRDEIEIPDQSSKNRPLTNIAQKRVDTFDFKLMSEYIPRLDYGDLGNSMKFQISFIESMNKYFGINDDDILGLAINKIEKKGIEVNSYVTNQIIIDAQFEDFDNLAYEFKTKGRDIKLEISKNDIEKTFNYYCYKLLQEQTDEDAKISNISRSWGPFKSALRIWLKNVFGQDSGYYYRVFINDIRKEASSGFRPAITNAFKEYKPILESYINKKYLQLSEKNIFFIRDIYYYPDNYEIRQTKLCILDKYCCMKEYNGKLNEDDFIFYIDSQTLLIDWWFKNGDYGRDYFSIKYLNTSENKEKLFYPDWIIKTKSGKFLILDTKNGVTLKNMEGRDIALAHKLKELGNQFGGGIVTKKNGVWHYKVIKDIDNLDYEWIELSLLLES